MQLTSITKITICLPDLKQPTTTVPNVQQRQLLGKLVTSIRVDEILVPTAPKQQPSTSEKCVPSCRVLAESSLDHMDITLSLRKADLEVMLQHFLKQRYEYKKRTIIFLCPEMSLNPGTWLVTMKWHTWQWTISTLHWCKVPCNKLYSRRMPFLIR